jgi:prephenate dehydrogenase
MSETVSALHFSKVVIVGVGLIGGSLALSLKRAGVVGTVVGVGRSAASLDKAKALGVIDEAASLEDAMRGASLVVLCAPVAQNSHCSTRWNHICSRARS